MMTLALLLALGAQAADDCDAKALLAEIKAASPVQAASLYVRIAECDREEARAIAPDQLPRFLSGDAGNQAVVAAIKVGAVKPAIAWIDGLQSDERASTISALGDVCNESKEIQSFFVNRAKNLGTEFWTQRWYRGLSSCQASPLQDILWQKLEKGPVDDRTGYFGVLETYARSAGGAAVPKLKQLALDIDDEEAQTYIVAAFADAARVGSMEGTDAEAARAGIAAVVEIAPKLHDKAVEQARITVKTLGDERVSDELVAVRYKDLQQEDGSFLWGTVIVENATCKNGKEQQRFHFAPVFDPGQTWPDQLHDKVKSATEDNWDLGLARRCKGEGTIDVLVPPHPFGSKGDLKKWTDEQIREKTRADVKKPSKQEEDPVRL